MSDIPISFQRKKANILASLAVPEEEYSDLSPKGSVDKGIRKLIHDINRISGCVTTSSCAGRISVFLEGRKKEYTPYPEFLTDNIEKSVPEKFDTSSNDHTDIRKSQGKKFDQSSTHASNSVGGKGRGGRWLFVSHDPVKLPTFIYSSNQRHRHRHNRNGVESDLGDEKQEEQVSCIQLLGMQELQTPDNEIRDADVVSNNATMMTTIGISRLFSQPNLSDSVRMIHFKFEPMILHILTASLAQANRILIAAVQAGFRESGAINLLDCNREKLNRKQRNHDNQVRDGNSKNASAQEKAKRRAEIDLEATPMVAIRSNGLALESIVGLELNSQYICMIPEWQMRGILLQANQRFIDNTKRINRFAKLLMEKEMEQEELCKVQSHPDKQGASSSLDWEDPVVRRARKRQEGLHQAKVKAERLGQNKPQSIQDSEGYNYDLGCLGPDS